DLQTALRPEQFDQQRHELPLFGGNLHVAVGQLAGEVTQACENRALTERLRQKIIVERIGHRQCTRGHQLEPSGSMRLLYRHGSDCPTQRTRMNTIAAKPLFRIAMVTLAVLTAGALCAPAMAAQNHPLTLWKVTGPKGHVMYMAGSMHMLNKKA